MPIFSFASFDLFTVPLKLQCVGTYGPCLLLVVGIHSYIVILKLFFPTSLSVMLLYVVLLSLG